ncbi:hypothetical protein B9Z65_4957 [Elsinoe australis]|uniref:Enoyl reductase (ER) domain-containing protein n=1 Tax=Elsinoe australis TaxID=40998 RepID=A0A2P7ZCR6_9PEZI|nr:hypothetical protein B9Z65_4957 [Elsinoe australis]
MASNQAAWLEEKQQYPFKIGSADVPKAGPDQLVIKNHALAINPVDWKIQSYGFLVEKFPMILGCDVAGEVYEVGSNVKDFRVGDRVTGHALSLGDGQPQSGGFQLYTAVYAVAATKLPSNVSYTQGSVLPLAVDTAIVGLYGSDILALPYPELSPKPSNKVILIWGGSSSVGGTAVQLAKASGVTVITTASAHNREYAKYHLGADKVLDHKSPSIVDDVVDAIKSTGKEFAGVYDSISVPESFKPIGAIFEKLGSGSKKLAVTLPASGLPDDVQAGNVFAATVLNKDKAVAEHVWGKFLYTALEKGSFKPLPEALVIGKGLENVQKATDKNKEGVSAKKVVVEL